MKKNKNINLPAFMRNSNTESVGQYISLCISCWLITVGLSILVNAQFEFEIGLPLLLVQTFAIMAFLSAIAFARWLSVTYLVGIVISFVVLISVGGEGHFFGDLQSFAYWCISGMPEDNFWYTADNVSIMHFFINLGICALVYILACTSQKSKLCSLLCFGAILSVYAFGYAKYDKSAIFFFFAGLFTLISTDKSRGKRLFKHADEFSILGKHYYVPLIAFGLCVPLALGALLILNNNKEYDIRNRFCSNIAADIQTAVNIYTPEQTETDITLYDLGLQENEDYIGGDLPENESEILATTSSSVPILAKVATFDSFNGKTWKSDFEPSYRANGPWEEEFVQYMSSSTLDKKVYFDQVKQFLYSEEITFTLKTDSFFLPTVGQITSFKENTETKNPTLFDQKGRLFSFFGQKKDFSYTVKSHVYLTQKSLSDYESLTIFNLMNREDKYYTAEFIEKYTKIPLALPDYVTDAVNSIKIEGRSKYDTALAITKYFSTKNGYSYIEKGLDFASQDNVLTKVFRAKSGHSVYYATAAALVLRHLQVPCRLVAGYYTVAGENGTQVIDRANPYCWIECYFPNLGWIAFDPSPKGTASKSILSSGGKNPIKEETPPEEDDNDEEQDEPTEEVPQKVLHNDPVKRDIRIFIYTGIFLFVLLYLFLRSLWSPLCYNFTNVRKRFSTTEKQCNFYWRDILRQLNTLESTSNKGITLRERVERLTPYLTEEDMATVSDALLTVEELRYGDIAPKSEKLENIARTHEILEQLLKNKCNPVVYFVKRRMFLIVF